MKDQGDDLLWKNKCRRRNVNTSKIAVWSASLSAIKIRFVDKEYMERLEIVVSVYGSYLDAFKVQ